jgi:hypothetical protein
MASKNHFPKIGFRVGAVRVWLWAGEWSVFDRSGYSRFSLKNCPCHRFSLYVGPCGIEVA